MCGGSSLTRRSNVKDSIDPSVHMCVFTPAVVTIGWVRWGCFGVYITPLEPIKLPVFYSCWMSLSHPPATLSTEQTTTCITISAAAVTEHERLWIIYTP